MRHSSMTQRAGHVDSHATLLRAATLAAHAVHAVEGGFRAVDVRFFFRLFGNWLEHDVSRPSQDIELTQLRRTLETLARAGHLQRLKDSGARGKRFRLTEAGMLELAERLVDECSVAYDEVLFVLLFATSYRDILRARVLAASPKTSQATRRRLARVLDATRIANRAVRHYERLAQDLRDRIAADQLLDAQLRKAMEQARVPDAFPVLDSVGGYQLERVQPLAELFRVLPRDLRDNELRSGIAMRRSFLFEPLLARTERELASLQQLASAMPDPLPSTRPRH